MHCAVCLFIFDDFCIIIFLIFYSRGHELCSTLCAITIPAFQKSLSCMALLKDSLPSILCYCAFADFTSPPCSSLLPVCQEFSMQGSLPLLAPPHSPASGHPPPPPILAVNQCDWEGRVYSDSVMRFSAPFYLVKNLYLGLLWTSNNNCGKVKNFAKIFATTLTWL